VSWRRYKPTTRQTTAAFGVALGLLVLFDSFVVESVVIPTESMVPTILPNERVWLVRGYVGEITRFEVVVVREPGTGMRLAKRVIGLPGERVRVSGPWTVEINGAPLAENWRGSSSGGGDAGVSEPTVDVTLGPTEYFVMGDNRTHSVDSRSFGPVQASALEGRLAAVWYSVSIAEHRVRWSRVFSSIH
jgi:signal peptidase I